MIYRFCAVPIIVKTVTTVLPQELDILVQPEGGVSDTEPHLNEADSKEDTIDYKLDLIQREVK